MHNFITLVKALFKQGNPLGSMSFKSARKSGTKRSGASSTVATAIASVFLLGFMGSIGYGIGSLGQTLGMDRLFFIAMIAGIAAIVLFIAIPSIITSFYVADDIETLLALPISPMTIVAAKLTIGMLYSYATVGIFFVPLVVGWGLATAAAPVFWLSSVVAAVLLPVIPFAYAAIISLVVARVFKAVRTKDGVSALTMVMSLLAAALIIGLEYALGVFGETSGEALEAITNAQGAITGAAAVFPSAGFCASAMAGEGIHNLLIALCVCAVAVAVVLLVARIFYLPTVTNLSSGGVGSRKLDAVQMRNALGAKDAYKAYVDHEWTRIWRSPVVVFNCVVGTFILPVIIIVSMVVSWIAISGSMAVAQADFADLMAEASPFIGPIATLAVCGLVVYSSLSNMLSGTAVTRWGSDWETIKLLPISYKDQVKAMLTPGIALGFVVTCAVAAVVMVPMFFFGLTPVYLLLSLVFCAGSVVLDNLASIVPDTKNPRLVWDNEQEAIKNNFAPFLAELPPLLFVTLLLVGAGLAWGLLGWDFLVVFTGASAVLVAVCVFFGKNRFVRAVENLAGLEG